MNSIRLTYEQSKDADRANFNFLSKMAGKGKVAANVASDVPSELLSPRTVSGVAGATLGGALGQLGGGAIGMYKGATYNPDIIDPETGEQRKLGLAARAGLVLGGSSLGSLGGRLLGTGAGAIAGAAIPSKLGGQIADKLVETKTVTMSRYPGAPAASFKHGNYREANFN